MILFTLFFTTTANRILLLLTMFFYLKIIFQIFHQKYSKHLNRLVKRISEGIPLEFDARDKWPECELGRIYDQGGCGSCWVRYLILFLRSKLRYHRILLFPNFCRLVEAVFYFVLGSSCSFCYVRSSLYQIQWRQTSQTICSETH